MPYNRDALFNMSATAFLVQAWTGVRVSKTKLVTNTEDLCPVSELHRIDDLHRKTRLVCRGFSWFCGKRLQMVLVATCCHR